MKMPEEIDNSILSTCGVNCLACSAHLSLKDPCPGCRASDEEITRKSCRDCMKKKCAFEQGYNWCFECGRFPCSKVRSLNKRYLRNYNVDLIQNGADAKQDMQTFLHQQKLRFTCTVCGGIVDQHRCRCSECGSAVSR